MTELADEGRVQHRAGVRRVESTREWRRKVGGRSGSFVVLPAGTYSDDTQLRLATARAIRADGSFDVAAFAKVEIPAWANYALGAGLGSKEAAKNLSRTSATWYSNFFRNRTSDYLRGGGNGAAMRIQPHVWSARDLSDRASIFRDVIRNSICTHGHPRGIIGACFHANMLRLALKHGEITPASQFADTIDDLRIIPEVIEADADLRLFWLGPWLQGLGTDLNNVVTTTLDELRADTYRLDAMKSLKAHEAYEAALIELGGKEPATRGSGTTTALLASFLASSFHREGVQEALIVAANSLGSDTDSIATMAGAIMGSCASEDCKGEIQDRPYIEGSAERLARVAEGTSKSSFGYPDLRSWKPPKVALDAIAATDSGLVLVGIGPLEQIDGSKVEEATGLSLQWLRLEFGQSILGRVRDEPLHLGKLEDVVVKERQVESTRNSPTPSSRLPDLFSPQPDRSRPQAAGVDGKQPITLNASLERVIESGFDPATIGEMLLAQVRPGSRDFVERSVALAATIVTAYEARSRRRRQ